MPDEQKEPTKFGYLGSDRLFDTVDELFDHLEEEIRRKPWWWHARCWIEAASSNLKWWFLWRFHPRHRYNVVRTGLKPGYYDVDRRMEAAIITLFKEFIEIEKPFDWFDTEAPETKEHWDKIKHLYARVKDIDVNRLIREDPDLDSLLNEILSLRGHYWT